MKSVTDLTKEGVKPLELAADCKDYVGRTFFFHDVDEKSSQFGPMAIAIISETENGEKGKMFMRGEKVAERLKFIKTNNGFPCLGKIVKVGKAWELE